MKPYRAAMTLIWLAACAADPVVPPTAESFRAADAQIASQTDVIADRMAGEWIIRQSFASTAPEKMMLQVLPGGALQLDLPPPCADCATAPILLRPSGPGRWQAVDTAAQLPAQDIWVMWMDFDSRTAALGTPSGTFGWIIDRAPTGGGDRITAAREIMDWFGYDIARLQSAP